MKAKSRNKTGSFAHEIHESNEWGKCKNRFVFIRVISG
jgi:hypothetical protein